MSENLKIFNLKVLLVLSVSFFCLQVRGFDDAKNNNLYLFRAAKNGDLDWVKRLVEKLGADVNYKTSSGKTVLIKAVSRKKNKVVEYLLALKDKTGEDKTWKDKAGKNLVDFNCADKNGQTALHKAVKNGDLAIVKMLIKVGADKNKQDRWGNTSLHVGANRGNLDIVKELVSSNNVNTKGLVARNSNVSDGVNGANLEIKNKKGDTPLHEAVKAHYKLVVEFLIKSGAQVNTKNNTGKVPLDYAKDDIKVLFKRNAKL